MEVPGKEDKVFERIQLGEFAARSNIDKSAYSHSWNGATCVVSLREISEVLAVQEMDEDYLHQLLSSVVLVGGNRTPVYHGCSIEHVEVSANEMHVGQTFVEIPKCYALLADFGQVFKRYSGIKGFVRLTAKLVLGYTKDGVCAIAHYIPPLLESNGTERKSLLDGIHRNWICRLSGVPVIGIRISGVKEPFPCSTHDWSKITPVTEKPPKDERFFDLKPDLFRDLKWVGIDG
jgi:hypothetical protein